jgi:hypothetical protein
MADNYVVIVEGMSEVQSLIDETTGNLNLRASQAINKTLDHYRAKLSKGVRSQINFAANYVGPNSGRLSVSTYSSRNNLYGKINARDRPTSLARFVKGTPRRGAGVRVEVSKGVISTLSKSFLINLNGNNRGLAIRSNTPISNKRIKVKPIKGNLYLLYGPSVNQIVQTILDENENGQYKENIAAYMEAEFARLRKLDI